MIKVKEIAQVVGKAIEKNLPTILTVVGIGGMVSTTVIACVETPKAIELLNKKKEEKEKLHVVDKVSAVAPAYWPAATTGAVSIACLIFSNSVSLKRQAAALAAYSISEGKLEKYKNAIIDKFGEKKADEIKDEVAKETAKEANGRPIIITGNGQMMCIDSITKRKFKSDYDKVKQAFEQIDDEIKHNAFVPLNDLYFALGLEETQIGDSLGWFGVGYYPDDPFKRDNLSPEFSSQLDEDGVPCLVIDYSISPRWDYRQDSEL